MDLLEKKKAVVTGGARGIGKAICLVLAEEGADVAVADLDYQGAVATAQEVAAMGRSSAAVKLDIADHNQVKAAFDVIRDELGTVDILVNNAAITNNIAVIRKMTQEAWEREIAVNLGGAFNCICEVLDDMVKKQWGRIINISSGAGAMGGFGQAGYAASKAGLLGLTKTVALEHARDRITCNAILPGLIDTAASEAVNPEMHKRILKRIPIRELGKPEDIAFAVAFLASERARYINGIELNVSAGTELFAF